MCVNQPFVVGEQGVSKSLTMDYRQQVINLISTMIELNCSENMIGDITREYQGCYDIIKAVQSAGHSVEGITCSYKDFTTQKFWEHYKTKPARTWLAGNRESTLASMKPVFEPPIHPGSEYKPAPYQLYRRNRDQRQSKIQSKRV